jgi:glucosyl-dolichyl phosphate glucuronosyltransferase
MDVSVIVCTYNRAQSLMDTLQALVVQETPLSLRWEIIIVDNNSRDNTWEVVKDFAHKSEISVTYTFEPRQGQSHARNAGLKIARGEIIAFTDDDVIPAKSWVAKICIGLDRGAADGIGGRILPKWEASVPEWLEGNPHIWWCIALLDSEKVESLAWPEVKGGAQIWGANMAFRRSLFQDVGCFDTSFGHLGNKLYRGEESELIRRALQQGKKLLYDPTVTVYHRIGAERMTKKFFRKVAVDAGEAQAERSVMESSVPLLGAPRWLYRVAATEACRWMAHSLLGKQDAFGHQIDFLGSLGRLCGFWKLRFAPGLDRHGPSMTKAL